MTGYCWNRCLEPLSNLASYLKTSFFFSSPLDQTSKLKYVLRDARFFLIKSNNHENVSLAKAKVCSLSHHSLESLLLSFIFCFDGENPEKISYPSWQYPVPRTWCKPPVLLSFRVFGLRCLWTRRSWTPLSAQPEVSSSCSPWGKVESFKVKTKPLVLYTSGVFFIYILYQSKVWTHFPIFLPHLHCNLCKIS